MYTLQPQHKKYDSDLDMWDKTYGWQHGPTLITVGLYYSSCEICYAIVLFESTKQYLHNGKYELFLPIFCCLHCKTNWAKHGCSVGGCLPKAII